MSLSDLHIHFLVISILNVHHTLRVHTTGPPNLQSSLSMTSMMMLMIMNAVVPVRGDVGNDDANACDDDGDDASDDGG